MAASPEHIAATGLECIWDWARQCLYVHNSCVPGCKHRGGTGVCISGAVGVKASWKLKPCISVFRLLVVLISKWTDGIVFTGWAELSSSLQ